MTRRKQADADLPPPRRAPAQGAAGRGAVRPLLAAGAIPRTPRTTRSSRWAWWCPGRDDDVRAAMAIAREEGVPLLPRGGGTSQSGQTVGRALVIDFSQAPEPAGRRSTPTARTCIGRAGHRARRAEPAAQADGPVVPGRCLHRQPRHHRRHGRQQLLRHALDPLRHHARQRAGHRRDPGRRQRGALRRGGAQPRRRRPLPLAGEGQGGGIQTIDVGSPPTPNPSPQGGGGPSAHGEASHLRSSATCSPSAAARRSTSRTPSPRCRAASAAI